MCVYVYIYLFIYNTADHIKVEERSALCVCTYLQEFGDWK